MSYDDDKKVPPPNKKMKYNKIKRKTKKKNPEER
jgi:hypothetical protein